MKTAKLGDYFLWMGKIAQVVAINEGHKAIIFSTNETCTCPHCGKEFEDEAQINIIESSPLFQENAQPISTIQGSGISS